MQHSLHRLFLPFQVVVGVVFCWLLLGVQPAAHAQVQPPMLTSAPTSTIAGATARLTGANFVPGGYTGTILWDGVQAGTVTIPTGGSFTVEFVVPLNAAPIAHTVTVCAGTPCFTGAAAQNASASLRVSAAAPSYDARLAYVYDGDALVAKQFVDLLSRFGFGITQVAVGQVLATDFRQFGLTLLADDSGKFWSANPNAVSHIAKNSKVLGFGEGGLIFFGQQGLWIGSPQGVPAFSSFVLPVSQSLAYFQTPFDLRVRSLQIYGKDANAFAIPLLSAPAAVYPLGYRDGAASHATLVSEGCNHLWGYRDGPALMTAAGRNLLVNAVVHALSMPCAAAPQNSCTELSSPTDIPVGGLLQFDDLKAATVVGDHYAPMYGVHFENIQGNRALVYSNEPGKAASQPSVVINDAVSPDTSAGIPLRINFDTLKTHVGFFMGNGGASQLQGVLTAYDGLGQLLCRAVKPVPDTLSTFIGLYDAYGRIATVQLDYGATTLSEAIDDLRFAPAPHTWAIQLCKETADLCPPANGLVYRVNSATGGDAFGVDAQGYVLNSGQIAAGDTLWALAPNSTTPEYTLYRTSGTPTQVTPGALSIGEPNTLRLVASTQTPLMVRDFVLSAQMWVEGDPAKEAWLRANLIHAANQLYDLTDGQMTLGKVTVYQREDQWEASDLKLHSNNNLRPNAVIGGVVSTKTVDPSPILNITYDPGHIYMGSYWNRAGKPPGEPVVVEGVVVPPAAMEFDWATTLAHEFGHYFFFLWDTYRDAEGNEDINLTKICTGTVMGNPFVPTNLGYVASQNQWDTNCNNTEAYHILKGRNEWDTIQLWYPWIQKPTGFVAGPAAPPVNLTSINFVAPSVAPGPLATNQLFDLLYEGAENSSGEARGFLFRNNRIIEQGKPAKGSTQILLTDAQITDRLCVYDINDNAEGSETPRHQFGCESIQAGDAQLQMTKNSTWQPDVDLDQTGTSQLTLRVTQTLPADTVVMAKLYPEHGDALAEMPLTQTSAVFNGVFNLSSPVQPVYLQLWVQETPAGLATRREVVADRGTGGGGAFGPAKFLGGVLVVSSDGKSSFETDTPLELAPGESIAWQSMPGTPTLPPGLDIMGQSYRLDAFPPALVNNGRVTIQYEETAAALQSAGVNQNNTAVPTVYFWNGSEWRALTTSLRTPINAADGIKTATAPSQGVGVYAVLQGSENTITFLPLMQR